MRLATLSPALIASLAALGSCLLAPAAFGATCGDRPLTRGSHGHDVRVLQSWLGALGFRTAVDGRFGRRTVRAVQRYERHHGLRVDGRVSRLQARGLRRRADAVHAAQGAPATERATLSADGRTALAPPSAPPSVRAAIAAANEITSKPYVYGGGHGSFRDRGYDCSGAVSYTLHGAGLLDRPLDSSGLMSFGAAGRGRWITVYAHGGHAYVVIAGLRFDTSGAGEEGPRWRSQRRSPAGYTVRHPAGL